MTKEFKPFNARNVEPSGGDFDLIAKGDYKMVIVKSDYRDVKSGQGSGLNLEIDILDGAAKGRKLFEWLNLEHTNKEAEQIGQGRLSAICRAVNVMDLNHPQQLHDLPFIGSVGIRKDKKTDEERNVINSFKPLNGAKIDRKAPVNKDVTSKFEAPPTVQGSVPAEAEDDVPW